MENRKPNFNCTVCNKDIYVQKNRQTKTRRCLPCRLEAENSRIKRDCLECLDTFTVTCDSNPKIFCSKSCSATHNNRKRERVNYGFCRYCLKSLSSKKVYCNHSCQHKYQREHYIQAWLSGDITGTIIGGTCSSHIRNYLLELNNSQCSQCGWGETNPHTGTIPLIIDHISGNSEDNRRENLRVLCPNCDSLTSTYKGANKGNGRHYRKSRYDAGKSY